jgi:hypothetical protein
MPAPFYTQVGGSNSFIPTFDGEATGNLVVEYSRNLKSFPLNTYSEIRPVTLSRGYYLRIEPQNAARIRNVDGREFAWPPGSDRPTGTDNQERFQFAPYSTKRRAFSVRLDQRAVQQSAWAVSETELRAKGQQCMTQRATQAAFVLNAAFTGTSQTSTAAAITGNAAYTMDKGTPETPYIKIILQAIAIQINKATLGVINPQDLVVVMSPETAIMIAQSAEIQTMLSNSQFAYALLTGNLEGSTQRNWSLPPLLYGFRISVENTVRVTTARGSAAALYTYTIPKGTIYVLTRRDNEMINPSILKVETGESKMTDQEMQAVPVYSTLCGFMMEEFTVENRTDPWNRILDVSIATDYTYEVTQPLSGFMITSAVSGT